MHGSGHDMLRIGAEVDSLPGIELAAARLASPSMISSVVKVSMPA